MQSRERGKWKWSIEMNKRYLWIIEIKTKNGWEPSRIAYRSRKEAREEKKKRRML